MGVKSNCKDVVRLLSVFPERLERNIVPLLDKAGAIAVDKAKSSKTYKDQTGNLTASIGYGVVVGGQVVSSGGFGSGEGGSQGRATLQERAAAIGKGSYGLILVAGMKYATYVERSGHVVLDGAILNIDKIVNGVLSQINIDL